MKSLKTIAKYSLVGILFLTAACLFFIIISEPSPNSELSSTQFWLIKMGAIALMYLIFLVCKVCSKTGFSPNK